MKRECFKQSPFILLTAILIAEAAQAGIYPYLGTADEPSTVVTTQGVLQTEANQLTNLIENRLRPIKDATVSVRGTGFSAGDPLTSFSVWANVEYDHLDNSLSSTDYNGHVTFASAGFDNCFNWFGGSVGLAITWEEDKFDTHFNSGRQDTNAWAVIPYMAFMLTERFSLTFLIGYESLSFDLTRHDLSGNVLVGEPRGHRYFGGGELIFQDFYSDWDVSSQLALLYLQQQTGGFLEISPLYSVFYPKTNYHLGRLKWGGTLGYVVENCLEPYIRAAVLWDFSQSDIVVFPIQAQPSNSDLAGLFGIGLNFFSSDNVVFNADLYKEAFRDDFTHWGGMVNFRVTL